jgi:hypothetical protein
MCRSANAGLKYGMSRFIPRRINKMPIQGLMYEKAWDRSKKKGPVKVLI